VRSEDADNSVISQTLSLRRLSGQQTTWQASPKWKNGVNDQAQKAHFAIIACPKSRLVHKDCAAFLLRSGFGSLARAQPDPRSFPGPPRRRREGQRAKRDGESTPCGTRGHVLVASFNQHQIMGAVIDAPSSIVFKSIAQSRTKVDSRGRFQICENSAEQMESHSHSTGSPFHSWTTDYVHEV
jgi:hypothetical protein